MYACVSWFQIDLCECFQCFMQDQGSKAHRGIGFITFASAGQMILWLPWFLRLKFFIV